MAAQQLEVLRLLILRRERRLRHFFKNCTVSVPVLLIKETVLIAVSDSDHGDLFQWSVLNGDHD